MADRTKRLGELNCLLPEGPVVLRFSSNEPFLNGDDCDLTVGGHAKVWWYIGLVTKGFFLLLSLGLLLYTLYSATWNFGSATVESTSLELEQASGGPVLRYTYEVDGKSFQGADSTGSRSDSSWESDDASEKIRYLTFAPGQSHLDFRVEPFSWGVAIGAQLFLLGLAYAGHAMMGSQRKLEDLVRGCSHILPGQVVQQIPGQGFRIVVYQAEAPNGGETVRGTVQVGNAESVQARLVPGAAVAVLFADQKNHTLL